METPITGQIKDDVIRQLGERYNRKKSSLYEWFRICGVTIHRVGSEYTIDNEDVAKLDRLNEWINNGNRPIEFPERVDSNAITTVEDSGIEEHSTPLETGSIPDDFTQLIRVSQEKGAGLLIAQNLLAQQFAANPEMLPPDLLQQVKQTEQAIAPKSQSPKEYANRFIQLATA